MREKNTLCNSAYAKSAGIISGSNSGSGSGG